MEATQWPSVFINLTIWYQSNAASSIANASLGTSTSSPLSCFDAPMLSALVTELTEY